MRDLHKLLVRLPQQLRRLLLHHLHLPHLVQLRQLPQKLRAHAHVAHAAAARGAARHEARPRAVAEPLVVELVGLARQRVRERDQHWGFGVADHVAAARRLGPLPPGLGRRRRRRVVAVVVLPLVISRAAAPLSDDGAGG